MSGNNQTATVLDILTDPVVLLVKDQNGNSMAGVKIDILVDQGSVYSVAVQTDANGIASTRWTLGGTTGEQILLSKVADSGNILVEFSAIGTHITVTDYDNNTYNAVVIGDQVWMAENLKVTHYPNGGAIPHITDFFAWRDLVDNNTDDAYCFYNNNSNGEADVYGALYTYAAAISNNWTNDYTTSQGVCPDGWHLPRDYEWDILIDFLDGNEASKLASRDDLWEDGALDNNANFNTTGFSALPAGMRHFDSGNSCLLGYFTEFWMATESSSQAAYLKRFYYESSNTAIVNTPKSWGLSVRCIKD